MKFVIFPIYSGTVMDTLGKNLNMSESKKCLKQKMQRGGVCIFCPIHFSTSLILFGVIQRCGVMHQNCYTVFGYPSMFIL